MSSSKLLTRFLSVLAFAALGFICSSGAYADVVLRGVDGGTYANDGKFAWDKNCVDTATKLVSTNCTGAPTAGYLYSGPDSAGNFVRTATCWSRSALYGANGKEVACSTATGYISSSFTHHGVTIQGGSLTLTFGVVDLSQQVMTVEPGVSGYPSKVTVDIPDVSIQGTCNDLAKCAWPGDTLKTDLGTGRFHYHVEYLVPLATAGDANKGHGNDCGKCDPDNPSKKKYCTGCTVNQSCTTSPYNSNDVQFTVKAFCEQNVSVTGFLTLLPGQTPPRFVNCDQPTADSGKCTLQLGGLPLTSSGLVDPTACANIFTAANVGGQSLASKQLLLFQQIYKNTSCATSTLPADFGLEANVNAQLSVHRECNSDYGSTITNGWHYASSGFLGGEGFDNTLRICPSGIDSTGKTVYHTAAGTETAKTITVSVDVTPESVNLKCRTDSSGVINDNGVATATVCTTKTFNATSVDTTNLPVLFVKGDTACGGKPCLVTAKPGGFSFAAASTGLCSGDFDQDMQITYPTCTVVDANGKGHGLSQVIYQAGYQTDKAQVPLVLQGQVPAAGTNPAVGIQGEDTVNTVLNSSF